ncbi:hypothetical protein FXE96_10110 [Vibrio cholerae]|uniref:hypothetical protein n=1 Tax=Vibrio cholerae TaxID=666 RepID=UPI0011DB0925|nr:hypothetical protein [Vibrio cholerae]TXX76154.1 hypothetical protein FXE96_10110 [Vibrio cholerae]GIA27222.1 hypothetical protein VCSRO130_1405 [Vibrio cholerae]
MKISDFFSNLPWRTDGNVSFLYLTPEQNRAIAIAVNNHDRLVEENKRLREAISSAISIKDLWLPRVGFTDCPPENYGEIEALCSMAKRFEQLLSELSGE